MAGLPGETRTLDSDFGKSASRVRVAGALLSGVLVVAALLVVSSSSTAKTDIPQIGQSRRAQKPPSPRLLGIWETHGVNIASAILSTSGGILRVHAYGSCHPKLCDWGTAVATGYAPSTEDRVSTAFTAYYNFGFKRVLLAGRLGHVRGEPVLILESFSRFRSHTRSDYFYLDRLHHPHS
jgi:hypothetical protein